MIIHLLSFSILFTLQNKKKYAITNKPELQSIIKSLK